MIKNGVQVIHLATGLVVGYPPCTRITYFCDFIEARYGIKVVIGTLSIPQKYYDMHKMLGTWDYLKWEGIIQPTLADKKTRLFYN